MTGTSVAMAALEVRNLSKDYPVGSNLLGTRPAQMLRAVSDVSFSVAQGETFGLVGESGCGKSTLGRCILRLLEPTGGTVLLAGTDITRFSPAQMRPMRRDLQIVFQDPMSSLHPSMTIRRILSEGMRLIGLDKKAEALRIAELIALVQLPQDVAARYPH
jgi:ABC-type oligopeptide transport system ATPase subunit